MLHDEGEQFFLQVLFTGQELAPANYYLGLDDRTVLLETDTLATVVTNGEPAGNGYSRLPVAVSPADWTLEQDMSGDWQAVSAIVDWKALGGNIGPVRNLFLTDVASGTAGVLIASATLTQQVTLEPGSHLLASMTVKLTE